MSAFAEVVLNLPLDRTFTYRVPEMFKAQVAPGVRVRVPFGPRRLYGTVVGLPDACSFPRLKDLERVFPDSAVDGRLLQLARWMADRYLCSWGEAIAALVPSGVKKAAAEKVVRLLSAGEGEAATPRQKAVLEFARTLGGPLPRPEFRRRCGASEAVVASMIRSGLLRETKEEIRADLLESAVVERPKDIELTPDQARALETIAAGGVVLLHGVTGSGKTEVYLRAIEREAARGRQSIVLVPEIALTPQTLSRFKARFPRVAVLHSMLTEHDRAEQWRKARAGEVDVIVGARSAVFAPVRALGLIVLDEEHEGAYKQESVPRYHARDVAIERARLEGATVVLGSATPSLESLHQARQGGYRLARLPSRVEGRPLPEIEVVDMAAEEQDQKRKVVISRRLASLLKQALERREQALLFLNRRGFLTHVSCPRCGWFLHCGRCDVALTYHRQSDRALCHYCGDAAPMPSSCPACAFGKLQQYGLGTERIEAEIRREFPQFAVARMDSDSMRTRQDYAESIGDFWGGRTDVLVGTQMIAKGMDVPDVTLVGVVSADTAFHVPDFRAAERTFQLVTQVAGRTGRGPKGGRVVVQTHYPQHPAMKAAAAYDLEGFLEHELEARRDLKYPPFGSLVRVLVHGTDPARVEKAAFKAGEDLRKALEGTEAQVLGPALAPMSKLKGRTRMHLLLKAPRLEPVLPRLRTCAAGFPGDRTLQVAIDVDPLSLL
ncbi:MAG TPA: primosomal protein N' [Planctomycetota bacterium]|nr:primosomal protein N' [Planctomycetota bacterium]